MYHQLYINKDYSVVPRVYAQMLYCSLYVYIDGTGANIITILKNIAHDSSRFD